MNQMMMMVEFCDTQRIRPFEMFACVCERTCACVWSDGWLWFSGLIMGGNMISVGKKDHFITASRGQVHMFMWWEVKMIWKNNETKLLKSDKSFAQ